MQLIILSSLFFPLPIHIYTSSDKFYILANNWQIKDVLCDQRWFRKSKFHIVLLGLGQSLTLKSLSITTTTTRKHTNFLKSSRLWRRLRFDILRNWSPFSNYFDSTPPQIYFYPHPLFFSPTLKKKIDPHPQNVF